VTTVQAAQVRFLSWQASNSVEKVYVKYYKTSHEKKTEKHTVSLLSNTVPGCTRIFGHGKVSEKTPKGGSAKSV
jgi:hypothetical protein